MAHSRTEHAVCACIKRQRYSALESAEIVQCTTQYHRRIHNVYYSRRDRTPNVCEGVKDNYKIMKFFFIVRISLFTGWMISVFRNEPTTIRWQMFVSIVRRSCQAMHLHLKMVSQRLMKMYTNWNCRLDCVQYVMAILCSFSRILRHRGDSECERESFVILLYPELIQRVSKQSSNMANTVLSSTMNEDESWNASVARNARCTPLDGFHGRI